MTCTPSPLAFRCSCSCTSLAQLFLVILTGLVCKSFGWHFWICVIAGFRRGSSRDYSPWRRDKQSSWNVGLLPWMTPGNNPETFIHNFWISFRNSSEMWCVGGWAKKPTAAVLTWVLARAKYVGSTALDIGIEHAVVKKMRLFPAHRTGPFLNSRSRMLFFAWSMGGTVNLDYDYVISATSVL